MNSSLGAGRLIGIGVAVAVAYVLAARLGFRFAFVAEQVTTVWAPTGIGLAALLLWGPALAPAIWIGAFAANAGSSAPLWTAAAVATGNTLEAIAGAWMLTQVVGFDPKLRRLRDVVAMILVGAAFSTLVSATVGVSTLCLAGVQPWDRFAQLWRDWWLGDAVGALIVAPVILTAARHPRPSRRGQIEGAALVIGTVVATHVVFSAGPTFAHHPFEYVIFPFVVVAALRGGPPATAIVILVSSAVTIWHTLQGAGPFGTTEVHTSLIQLQAFMGILAGTGLLLAAAIAERETAQTDREQLLVREARARKEAETANQAKDEFLATLSHELRTPLNAIVGWCRMLRDGTLDPATTRRALEVIDRNAQLQAQLVADILDVSGIVTGKLRLELSDVDLGVAVAAALDAVRPAADAKGVRLCFRMTATTGSIDGDAKRLQQVVWNLLVNAVKFCEQGGQVSVEVRDGAPGTIQISVQDDGAGIDPEFLPHVFERFRQADASTSRRHGGLGLGLAIVRHMIELHGGTVRADSPGLGRGSTFTIELPVHAEPVAATVSSQR